MADLFLPVLSHFENENPWTASLGRMRYRIIPTVTRTTAADGIGEEIEGTVTVELWEGPWAYEFSTVEETATFPLTEEALAALPGWLEERAAQFNARPKRSLAEDLTRRQEPKKDG